MSDRLTAMDVENQMFSRKMRGFDPDEVTLYLRSVAAEIERLHLENANLREDSGKLRDELNELRSRERTLQQTLVTAQCMSEDMKDRARSEGQLVVQEARIKAEGMLQQTREQLNQLEHEVSRLKVERDTFENRLRSVIDQHLTMLDLRREARGAMDNLHVMPRRTGSEAG